MAVGFNPNDQSPIYKGAMTFQEIMPGLPFLTCDTLEHSLSFALPGRKGVLLSVDHGPVPVPRPYAVVLRSACGVSIWDEKRHTMLLDKSGICRDVYGRWNLHVFSVLATPEKMRELDTWQKERTGKGIAYDLWLFLVAVCFNQNVPQNFRRYVTDLAAPYIDEIAS